MKTLLRISLAALAVFSMTSCCGLIRPAGQEVNTETTTRTVERVVEVVDAKGGVSHRTITEEVAVEPGCATERVPCQKCLTTFCPTPNCCGSTGDVVIERATVNPANGNPNLGLVPTMRRLNEL